MEYGFNNPGSTNTNHPYCPVSFQAISPTLSDHQYGGCPFIKYSTPYGYCAMLSLMLVITNSKPGYGNSFLSFYDEYLHWKNCQYPFQYNSDINITINFSLSVCANHNINSCRSIQKQYFNISCPAITECPFQYLCDWAIPTLKNETATLLEFQRRNLYHSSTWKKCCGTCLVQLSE